MANTAVAKPEQAATQEKGPPKGYQKTGAQPEGYWQEEEGPIHGKLLEAKKLKTDMGISTLFVFQLIDDTVCRETPKRDADEATLSKGAIVGVFGGAGLNSTLLGLGGANVWIKYVNKIRVKRGTMKMYDIRFSGEAKPLRPVLVQSVKEEVSEDAEADANEDYGF